MSSSKAPSPQAPQPKEPTTETREMRLENVQPDAETKGLTQGQIVRKRFLGNTGAIASLVVLALIVLLAFTSIGIGPIPGWWKYDYTSMAPVLDGGKPTLTITGLDGYIYKYGMRRGRSLKRLLCCIAVLVPEVPGLHWDFISPCVAVVTSLPC